MINKKVEVGDVIVLKKICPTKKGYVVSAKFQSAMDDRLTVEEVGKDYIKVKYFKEEIPLDWVDHIHKKKFTKWEEDRIIQVDNMMSQCLDKSFLLKFDKFLGSKFAWTIVIAILGFIAMLGLWSDQVIPYEKGIGIPIGCCAYPLVYIVLYFTIARKSKKKYIEIVKSVVDTLNINYCEYCRLQHRHITEIGSWEIWDEQERLVEPDRCWIWERS